MADTGDPQPRGRRPRVHPREWVTWALDRLDADRNLGAETNVIRFPLPVEWNIDLYLKDESAHPTGSLKHRLARSLFVHALCSGFIGPDTTIVEASSGSTAVSEAYFANLIGLRFVAVMPMNTSPEKVRLIEFSGGTCHFVERSEELRAESARLAREAGGYFMDQFRNAEHSSDWRSNDTIADAIEHQLRTERFPIPSWIVVGAGTGGTSASIGRFVRLRRWDTRVCVVDSDNSAYAPFWHSGAASSGDDDSGAEGDGACGGPRPGSRVEGIGRPTVEPSFLATVIDRMITVPDEASFAAMRWGSERMGKRVGGSTGTNLWGALRIAAEMRRAGRSGSIVTLLCDSGSRYEKTYFDDDWLAQHGFDVVRRRAEIDAMLRTAAEASAASAASAGGAYGGLPMVRDGASRPLFRRLRSS